MRSLALSDSLKSKLQLSILQHKQALTWGFRVSTGVTFKQAKGDLVKKNWDPRKDSSGDGVFWLNGTKYEKLDGQSWSTIETGKAKLWFFRSIDSNRSKGKQMFPLVKCEIGIYGWIEDLAFTATHVYQLHIQTLSSLPAALNLNNPPEALAMLVDFSIPLVCHLVPRELHRSRYEPYDIYLCMLNLGRWPAYPLGP